ncbi:MAG: septum formation initiator family protein [Clostridiales bacterium]|nr:septum formation initiator family protein [Clostridiales bacterium]
MRSRRKKKRRANTGRICISCMVLVLTLILSVQIVRLYHKDQSLQAQQEELEAQKTEEEQRAADLEEEEEYVGTDEYVEDVARSKLGMVYEDEILFKEE